VRSTSAPCRKSSRYGAGAGLQPLRDVPHDIKRFVYVLHSLTNPDRQFVESAANVPLRIAAHNAGHSPLTSAHRPWKLVAVVQFGSEATAQRFEKFLKTSSGRAFSKQHFT
jgi:predicted GIY-YIG superfamily endonuclease